MGKVRAAIDPTKVINLSSALSATERRGEADLIGEAEPPAAECLGFTLELQSNAEASGSAWIIRQKFHDQLRARYIDADLHLPFLARTPFGGHNGGAFFNSSGDSTLDVCQGGLTLDTPNGWGRLSSQMGSAPSDSRLNIIRLDIKDNGFTGGATSFGVVGRLLLSAKCVDEAFSPPANTQRIWTQGEIEEVMPGSLGSLGSQNFNGTRNVCGGGTINGAFSITTFRFIEPSTLPIYDAASITELVGQSTIEAWENQGSRPVVDFADIPQAADVRTGCVTLKGGKWYVHGTPGSGNTYEWQLYTAGFGSQNWVANESLIIRNGDIWPACIVPA